MYGNIPHNLPTVIKEFRCIHIYVPSTQRKTTPYVYTVVVIPVVAKPFPVRFTYITYCHIIVLL